MHISEGILPSGVLAAGALIAVGGVGIGLRKLTPEKIPEVALLSSTFFVASLIHLPVGPVSVHLVLNGLCGLFLGLAAFPAILVALALQALFFQYGGISVLGVNVAIMALPAVVTARIFRAWIRGSSDLLAWIAGCAVGALAVAMGALMVGVVLCLAGDSFREIALLAAGSHIPVMLVEGILTGFCVTFLRRVRPSLLGMIPSKLVLFFIIILGTVTAEAHRVNLFVWEDQGVLHAEGYFSSGSPCMDAEVHVRDSNGNLLVSGNTDPKGLFSCPLPGVGVWTVELLASMGHHAEASLEVRERPPSVSEPSVESSLPFENGTDSLELENRLRRVLREELYPLRETIHLSHKASNRPGVTEILGGIGIIVGLAGAYLWGISRSKI